MDFIIAIVLFVLRLQSFYSSVVSLTFAFFLIVDSVGGVDYVTDFRRRTSRLRSRPYNHTKEL